MKSLKEKIKVSVFANCRDTTPRKQSFTAKDLIKKLSEPRVREQKDGPMITFARFGSVRNPNGNLKHQGNVVSLSGIVLDIDCKNSTPLTAKNIQQSLGGVFYVAHTTFSHTKAHPKWHIFVPFMCAVGPERHQAAFDFFNGLLSNKLDPAGKSISLAYYLPSCPKKTKKDFQVLVNWDELFDASKLEVLENPTEPRRGGTKKRCTTVGALPVADLPIRDVEEMDLPEALRDLIVTGDPGEFDDDRSKLAHYVISQLVHQGWTDEQIASVLLNADYGISERHREKGVPWTLQEIARVRAKQTSKRYIEGVGPFYSKEKTFTPEHAKERLANFIAQFFAESNRSFGIGAAAGLGKTRAVIKALAKREAGQGCVEIYVPSHKLGQEFVKTLRSKAPHLRTALIRGRTHEDENGDTLCQRSGDVKRLSRYGLSIYQSLCRVGDEKCSHFSECPYLAQFGGRDDVRILTHSHLGLRRSGLEGKPPERAIIDESFWPAMIKTRKYKTARIAKAKLKSKELGQTIQHALTSGKPLLECLWKKCGKDLPSLLDTELERIEGKAEKVSPELSSREVTNILATMKNWGFERRLLSTLREEVGRFPERKDSMLIRQINEEEFAMMERQAITRFTTSGQNETAQDIPVLCIDASLIPTVAKAFLPELKCYKIAVERNAQVIQCYSTRNSKMRFRTGGEGKASPSGAGNHIEATQGFLDKLCEQSKVLVVSYERVVGNPKKGIPPMLKVPAHCATEYFGSLRGIDKYKDCDTCVVIGRHQFPCSALESMAAAIWWDSPKPLNLTGKLKSELRGYCLTNKKLGVRVEVHPDPRVQQLQEQVREGETLQAIDRLRLIHNKQRKKVIILSNLPLPITVDEVKSWKEFTSGKMRLDRLRECYPDGVIPLSPKFLCSNHGDLFPTEDSAKKWGERLRRGAEHQHIHDFISDNNHIINTIKNSHFIKYKVRSEKGKSKMCLCLAPMAKASILKKLKELHQSQVDLLNE